MTQSPSSLNTRHLAVEILNNVGQQNHTLDHWLDWSDTRYKELIPRDRAFIRSIVYGTIRWQSRLDWIIDQFATRPVSKIDPMVCTILRMGLFQLLYMDRVPVSAAVNTSVELAKNNRRHWAAGFINKVLRRAAIEFDDLPWPDEEADPVKYLVVDQAFPEWMIERWLHRWGVDPTKKLCRAMNTIPTMTLRTNTLITSRNDLIEALKTTGTVFRPTPFSPEGLMVSSPLGPLSEQPAFGRGWFQIQDEAAQLVSHLLNPQPGQIVWDACAGLGTKTGHLAQLMKNQGRLFATDVHGRKLDALAVEMKRLGVTIVEQQRLDLSHPDSIHNLPEFDRILLDAPCSGMGVIRKNPDCKWSQSSDDFLRHHQRQTVFLDSVARHLRPGGILVYSVCSMEPEETQSVVEEFLRKHPEFDIYTEFTDRVDNFSALMTAAHWLFTTPQDHDMDGFFAAALIKQGA